MAEDSTAQLQVWIERLKAGDPAARNELIGRSCKRLRRITRKMLQDFSGVKRRDDTDDVLHNAILRLLRALETVPLTSVLEFFQLATRHIRWELLDLARRYAGIPSPEAGAVEDESASANGTPPPVHEVPASTYEPSRLAAWSEFHAQVEKLPDEERQVFELLWYQGLKRAEAAAVLGVSAATVWRRWLAARVRLQDALHGWPLPW